MTHPALFTICQPFEHPSSAVPRAARIHSDAGKLQIQPSCFLIRRGRRVPDGGRVCARRVSLHPQISLSLAFASRIS